jgi:carbonic anhydrase
MTVIDDLTARNAEYAQQRFDTGLRINPSRQTMIVGCVDPRVATGLDEVAVPPAPLRGDV